MVFMPNITTTHAITYTNTTNDFLQPRQNYNPMYGTEPRYNEGSI